MSNRDSRTLNVAKNAGVSLLCQLVNILLQFINRTLFIYTLGKEYLGVGGLFANVLTILSVAELGISNAMVYSLYKPVAQQDTQMVASYVRLFRNAYRAVACFIAILGLLLLPALRLLIGEVPEIRENISVIYLLYLSNTVCSYFFSYKSAVLAADQRQYMTNIIHQLTKIGQTVVQVLVLVLTGDFLLYLAVCIVFTLVGNLMVNHQANRLYPELRRRGKPLDKTRRKAFFQDMGALAVYKFAGASINGSDNILITAMFSVADVGMSANYLMLTSLFEGIFSKITNAFTGSIGNLNVRSNPEKQYEVFSGVFFLSAWLYGLAAVGILLLGNEVIALWLGRTYVLDFGTVLAVTLVFYESGMRFASYTYRTTLGLFRAGQVAPICAAVLNLLLSVLLGKTLGLCGVYFATFLARALTNGIVDPVLVFKKAFPVPPIRYYLQYLQYAAVNVMVYFAMKYTVCQILPGGILGIAGKIVLISAAYCLTMLLLFRRTRQFRLVRNAFVHVWNSLFRRKTV